MLKQQEIGLSLLAIRKAMNIIDDGHHQEEYSKLIEVSNGLFVELNNVNQAKFRAWLENRGSSF